MKASATLSAVFFGLAAALPQATPSTAQSAPESSTVPSGSDSLKLGPELESFCALYPGAKSTWACKKTIVDSCQAEFEDWEQWRADEDNIIDCVKKSPAYKSLRDAERVRVKEVEDRYRPKFPKPQAMKAKRVADICIREARAKEAEALGDEFEKCMDEALTKSPTCEEKEAVKADNFLSHRYGECIAEELGVEKGPRR